MTQPSIPEQIYQIYPDEDDDGNPILGAFWGWGCALWAKTREEIRLAIQKQALLFLNACSPHQHTTCLIRLQTLDEESNVLSEETFQVHEETP